MATIEDLRSWIERDITHFATPDNHVDIVQDGPADDTPEVSRVLRMHLYTDNNRYHINAREYDTGKTYLGCTASSRKPRAGEDWTRGRDMHDGPLSEETWTAIFKDIVCYELVKVAGLSIPQFVQEMTILYHGAAKEDPKVMSEAAGVPETIVMGWVDGFGPMPESRIERGNLASRVSYALRNPGADVSPF